MARTSLLDFSNTRLYKTTTSNKGTFTVDTTDDYIIDASHGMVVGDLVEFVEVDVLPVPLAENTVYSVWQVIDSGNFMVSINGYEALNITTTGAGANTYKYYNTNVTIDNFIVNKDQAVERGFFHESPISGHREWITKGIHWEIELKSQLFQTSSLSTRRTDFDELWSYLYTDVYVARCNESQGTSLIRDSSSDPVKFIMDKFETSFLTQANFEDIVTIGLKSKDYVDMSKTV